MRDFLTLAALAIVIFGGLLVDTSSAINRHRVARQQAATYTWHGRYYEPAWGTAVGLVVPPTAEVQTDWGWGVTNTRVSWIDHQYRRPYPGFVGPGQGFRPAPVWPSDTRQFGVYSVRGPW